MREVDARGLDCPQPVILTRKAFLEAPGETLLVIVDNQVARDNVLKMTQSLGGSPEVEQSGDEFRIYVRPGEVIGGSEGAATTPVRSPGSIYGSSTSFHSSPAIMSTVGNGTVVLLKSAALGQGSEELGRVLMKSFLYTLRESPEGITTVICLNSGVYLTCEGSDSLEHFESLEKEGVEILSCGTCLDFFNLKNSLKVGKVSNMYSILELLQRASKVIAF